MTVTPFFGAFISFKLKNFETRDFDSNPFEIHGVTQFTAPALLLAVLSTLAVFPLLFYFDNIPRNEVLGPPLKPTFKYEYNDPQDEERELFAKLRCPIHIINICQKVHQISLPQLLI